MTLTTKGRRVRWEDSPREDLMAGVQRRFLYGEKAMLAQIWLKKGTTVPRHVHPAEQLSFIVEGALRLRLGDDLSEVHDVRAGEVLVIPANVPHEAVALEDTYDLDVFSPPRGLDKRPGRVPPRPLITAARPIGDDSKADDAGAARARPTAGPAARTRGRRPDNRLPPASG